MLHDVLLETVREQRLKRRWGIFFKLCLIALIAFIMWGSSCSDSSHNLSYGKKHIAQIQVFGEIALDTDANAADLIEALDAAATDPNTQAILLDLNSPGGSPVQASYVYNEVRRLRALNPKLPIDSVCEDLCASAAYYIASSTANIYANPASLVGSIGVLMDEFGFVDVMKKFGVSRRLFTAGEHKAFLDPFSPLKTTETLAVQQLLDDDHQLFIHDVKQGRGQRLVNDSLLFSGLIWNGHQALPLGLIDGFGSIQDIARNVYHNETIVDYTTKRSYLDKLIATISSQFFHRVKNELLHYSIS